MALMIDVEPLAAEIAEFRETEQAWHEIGERFNKLTGDAKIEQIAEIRTKREAHERACQWLALRVVNLVKDAEAAAKG